MVRVKVSAMIKIWVLAKAQILIIADNIITWHNMALPEHFLHIKWILTITQAARV